VDQHFRSFSQQRHSLLVRRPGSSPQPEMQDRNRFTGMTEMPISNGAH
jgi:hypothetical protein